MTQSSVEITFSFQDTARIPDVLTEGTVHLMDYVQRGVVEEAGERLRIRRQGGYSGLDVWLLLCLYYSTGTTMGIRGFWEVLRPCMKPLATLAGRRSLPSPASLSRALASVELDLLREQSTWILTGATAVDDLLKHPAMQTYDAVGDGWHVFDLDPTVTTLRQRALPERPELPEPQRRSENTGAPGYSGRKRGDVQYRRCTVQHAGSSIWIHAHLSPGNGLGMADFELSLDSIVSTCERLDHPIASALVRMDGEFGNVPSFTACRERSLPFITRLNRPKLFEDPEVLRLLRAAIWHQVEDSCSGPQRAAADLGMRAIAPGKRTRRADGSTYDPVIVRIVASIFRATGKAKRGRVIDGWQVELFAADVPADAWPAPEVITAYYGRTSQENRFYQEDRELGLDRIISYELPGQEFAALVGLSIWNRRVVRGFESAPPPERPAVQRLRQAKIDQRVPEQWPRDPMIVRMLNEVDCTAMLNQRPGWIWHASIGELECSDGRLLRLTTVRGNTNNHEQTGIIFRRPVRGCEDCSSRSSCLQSANPHTAKHTGFSVPTELADRIRARLNVARGKTQSPRTIEPLELKPGKREIVDARFLPAEARQAFRAMLRGATLRVELEIPSGPARPRLMALDVADRQRRRKTWRQNLERYAASTGASVRVEVAAGMDLRRVLGDDLSSRVEVNAGG